MAKYAVSMEETCWVTVYVEADSEDEALEKGYEAAPDGICAHCTGWGTEWGRDHEGPWGSDRDEVHLVD